MEEEGKTREEMLIEWKEQRALRPVPGLTNITNKPLPATAAHPLKPSVTFAEPQIIEEKENPTPIAAMKASVPDVASTPASIRKAALSAPHREQMEQQFDLLQGRLHAIRRDSLRPSISGASVCNAPAAPTAPTAAPASSLADEDRDQPLAAAAPPMGGLAAKLETLKRESMRPSFASSGPQQVQFEAAGQYNMQALSRLAQQLFGDQEFSALCERGMNAQLTRSKDGATDETKIKELAGMVKMLRRGMKEIQQRTQMFIDQSVRFEKEAAQQVEGVKLASESAAMAAQADLANARREAATATANHKTALVNWKGELDLHKAEAATLRREMERMEGERDRAREEARRAEVARASMEVEVKDARKSQAQRERDLQVDKNSTAQALYEAKEAFERTKTTLEQSLAAATARADEAEATVTSLSVQLAETEATVARVEGELAAMTAARDGLSADKDTLTVEVTRLRGQLEGHLQEHDKVVTGSTAVMAELSEWQKKAAELLSELETEREAAAEAARAAENAANAAVAEKSAWEATKAEFEGALGAAAAKEKILSSQKVQLESELAQALQQHSAAAAAAAAADSRLHAVESEAAALAEQRSSLAEEVAQLGGQVEAARREAEEATAALSRVSREANDSASKLAHLEGELEALQECTMGLQGGDQKELLSRMVSKIATLEAAVVSAEARRREAHNQLVELKGNIRVFCRIRPHPRPIALPGADGSSLRVLADTKEHTFGFDRVFKPQTSQAAVFDEVSDVVQSALDGYKVCLFSYGQTGAGKTHTMQGGHGPGEQGIIPRSVSKILATVARLREQGWEYSLEASYIEVYNEQLRDLLAEGRSAGRITESNAIQHQPNGGHTIILGANRLPVDSEVAADALVRKAAAARAVESTAMNAVSSRSHSVFMLYITGRHEATGTLLQGSLNLVDLAGSERLARSQAEGQRAREACSINKSLSSLGDVFAALGAKQSHVPYRNSKLTHLLQPCLGGSGKTLMFVNINPEPESAGESLCSLRFAAKVNACETGAKGGAARNVMTSTTTTTSNTGGSSEVGSGGASNRSHGGGVDAFKSSSLGMSARPALTGRASVAPGMMSSGGGGGGARRMSMIPSAGSKRPAMGPPAALNGGSASSRVARPKFN